MDETINREKIYDLIVGIIKEAPILEISNGVLLEFFTSKFATTDKIISFYSNDYAIRLILCDDIGETIHSVSITIFGYETWIDYDKLKEILDKEYFSEPFKVTYATLTINEDHFIDIRLHSQPFK